MVKKEYAVALDMKRARSVQTDHIVVEEDNGCEFLITLTDDGQPMTLTGCTILAHFALPTGATREQTSSGSEATITFTNNVITLPLATECIVAGQIRCEIVVLSTNEETNDTQVTSAQFTYKVRRAIVNGDTVLASNEFPILLQAITSANSAAASANSAASSATSAAGTATTAANTADVATQAANTAATSASSAATAASSIATKWSNPSVTVQNGDTPAASWTVTETGVRLDLTVQKGADGRPAEIGTEAGILVETGTGGVLVAGRKLKVGTDDPEDVTGLRIGDIYVKENECYGEYYTPSVSAAGVLSWSKSNTALPDVASAQVAGEDGYSPIANVVKVGNTATITITDQQGTTTATVSDGSGTPSGGTTGQVLAKASATDYDVAWRDVHQIPSGGTAGQVLRKSSATDYDTEWATPATVATYTLSAASWGASSPYTYTLSVTGATATNTVEILPTTGVTAAQLKALQEANIQDGGQAAGSITLKAFGKKPSIDLPIRVLVRGDM